MKKFLLSTLVLSTMSSFALAGEPVKLDESQLETVAAGSILENDCGCFTPSFNFAAATKDVVVAVKDGAVAISQGGPSLAVASAEAGVRIDNVVSAVAQSLGD